jgi:hypothetical protein
LGRNPQVKLVPAETEAKLPADAVVWEPQQATVPSDFTPQV